MQTLNHIDDPYGLGWDVISLTATPCNPHTSQCSRIVLKKHLQPMLQDILPNESHEEPHENLESHRWLSITLGRY